LIGIIVLEGNLPGSFIEKIVFVFWISIIICTVCFLFLFQVFYINYYEKKYKKEFKINELSHAGGIVANFNKKTTEYLIITAKEDQEEWVFPKGHIRNKEGHGEAALREVQEETGCIAKILHPVGSVYFFDKKNDEDVRVKFYLMELIADLKNGENRLNDWKDFEKAVKKITHPESKVLLHKAKNIIEGKIKQNNSYKQN